VRAERVAGMRGMAAVAAVAGCAGLLSAACSTSSSPSNFNFTPPSPSAAASPTPAAVVEPSAPLTGLPTQPATAALPAVVLPLAGSTLEGLSQADVVYEEITSPLRYIAVFQSQQANTVGPITSTRPADGYELAVLRPLMGYDGGTSSFINVLDHTGVVDLGYGTHSSLYQNGADGLTTSTQALRHAASSAAPPELFSYRGAQSGSDALATTGESRPSSVTINLPGGYGTQKWAFDASKDLWQLTAGGPPVEVANLIVQTVAYKEVSLSTRYGLSAPDARVFGRGAVEAFSGIGDSTARGPGGLAASGEWSKPGLRDVTEYVDAKGFPMHFQPGPTWVILAPQGTQIQTTGATS
jgi:hypothetical protein